MNCSMPGLPVLHYLPEFAQTHALSWWCHPTISTSAAPSLFVFSLFQWVSCLHQAKVLELQFSISPSNEYSELISFRNNWFDVLAVQGILKSLLRHHGSKASILWRSALFMVQLSAWPNWCLNLCYSYSKYTRMSPCVFLFVTLTFNTCAWVRPYKWECVFGAHHLLCGLIFMGFPWLLRW